MRFARLGLNWNRKELFEKLITGKFKAKARQLAFCLNDMFRQGHDNALDVTVDDLLDDKGIEVTT